jgi:O-antigen/teichoic acid export membrane protein
VALFSQITFWGMDQVLTREVARNHSTASHYLGSFILIRVILASVLYVVMIALVLVGFRYPPDQAAAVLIAGMSVIFESVTNLCLALFVAFEQIRYQAVTKFIIGPLQIAIGVGVIILGGGARELAMVVTGASLMSLMINLLVVYRRFPHPAWAIDWRAWLPQLRDMFPFVLIGVFYTIEYQADALVLAQLGNSAGVGIYNAATTIFSALLMLMAAYRLSVFPLMSRLYITNRSRFEWVYQKSFKYLLLMSLPIALTIGLAAAPGIRLLYKTGFDAAIPVTQILLIAFVLLMMNVPSARAMVVANLQKWIAPLQGITMLLNISLNVLLIPRLGVLGPAWARLASTTIYFIITLILAQRHVVNRRLSDGLWQIGLAGAALFGATAGASAIGLPWIMSGLIGLAVYPSVLLLTRAIAPDELSIFREIWRSRAAR